jgi:RNA polymerase sigma-70 factor (ECF subfamily)
LDTSELKSATRKAAEGDERAAASLFDHYHPRLYRYALAKLGSHADADEVAAEVFARVLRDLDRFRWRGGGFEAWIFRIASNLVVDRVRPAARKRVGHDPRIDPRPAAEFGPESLAVEAESSAELRAKLELLAPDQREVLVLRFAAELDTHEVGRVMGRRPNAVRQLQFRALSSLRQMMSEEVNVP